MDSFSKTKLTPLKSKRNKTSKRRHKNLGAKEKNFLKIYAELNKKQYRQILDGDVEISIPFGSEMYNKAGSRSLYFTCENKDAVGELIEGLEASEISWQEWE